jgi:hypothetical protein
LNLWRQWRLWTCEHIEDAIKVTSVFLWAPSKYVILHISFFERSKLQQSLFLISIFVVFFVECKKKIIKQPNHNCLTSDSYNNFIKFFLLFCSWNQKWNCNLLPPLPSSNKDDVGSQTSKSILHHQVLQSWKEASNKNLQGASIIKFFFVSTMLKDSLSSKCCYFCLCRCHYGGFDRSTIMVTIGY